MSRTLTIGTRGSDLALWQANYTKDLLEKLGCEVRIKIIRTKGDRIQNLSFDKIEGKGFFTKEIEEELLSERIDIAVHSYKDLETTQPEGLCIAAVPQRESTRDLLLIRDEAYDEGKDVPVKEGITVGTSSIRRKTFLTRLRPDIQLKDLRGNVPTRIKKMTDGGYDAIVLAEAGFKRLGIEPVGYKVFAFSPDQFPPAPAQGALAIQTRETDQEVRDILSKVHQPQIADLMTVERELLSELEGGCHIPFGALAVQNGSGINLYIGHEEKVETLNAASVEELHTAGRKWLGLS